MKGAIELLLLRHGAVSEAQLERLLAATKTQDEDDMDERPTHDADGVIEDWVLDEAAATTRANAQPVVLQSDNGDEPDDSVAKELSLINAACAKANAEHNGQLHRKHITTA